MNSLTRFAISIFLFIAPFCFAQEVQFNSDSAYAYVKHLSVEIGDRVMGSAHEQEALQWVMKKFKTFGADTAYVMPVPKARRGINTTSGVAVGIFPGESDSIIVVGAHIDSDKRGNPGASDNASGTGCALELARIWGQQHREYTMLFAAFGGEEGSLVGSRYFADHFENIDKVSLMLNIDMASTEGWLIPFLESKSHQAPRWLVEDSYAKDRALGYNSLEYPTHFFSLNFSGEGAAGSDHIPFMDKDIPAIDFTAGVNIEPIHTLQDKFEFVSKPMLGRSGDLVNALIAKYQEQGIPAERKGNYMLWELFGGRLFIPSWMIIIFDALAVLLGIATFWSSRKNRLVAEELKKAKLTGLKLLFIMLIIAIFTQLGEAGMQLFKGLRYPWMAHINIYMWYAALWMLAGFWIGLQFTKIWRFNGDPYFYVKRAVMLLVILTILLFWSGPRLALYPALTLVIFSLGVLLPGAVFKIPAMILAPLPMLRLMFVETFPLFARSASLAGFQIDTFLAALIYSGIITLVLLIWFLPSLYVFAYTVVKSKPVLQFAKLYRSAIVGLALLLAVTGVGGYLYSFSAYTEKWQPSVRVHAEYQMPGGKSTLRVESNEYLRDVSVKVDTLERYFDERSNKAELPVTFQADWLRIEGVESAESGERDMVSINWQLISEKPWYRTTLILRADTANIEDITTALNYREKDQSLTFAWFAEPPDTIDVQAKFSLEPGAKLIRTLIAAYPETPVPVEAKSGLAEVMYQTTVTYRDTLAVSKRD